MYLCVAQYMSVYPACARACGGQKKVLDSTDLELTGSCELHVDELKIGSL